MSSAFGSVVATIVNRVSLTKRGHEFFEKFSASGSEQTLIAAILCGAAHNDSYKMLPDDDPIASLASAIGIVEEHMCQVPREEKPEKGDSMTTSRLRALRNITFRYGCAVSAFSPVTVGPIDENGEASFSTARWVPLLVEQTNLYNTIVTLLSQSGSESFEYPITGAAIPNSDHLTLLSLSMKLTESEKERLQCTVRNGTPYYFGAQLLQVVLLRIQLILSDQCVAGTVLSYVGQYSHYSQSISTLFDAFSISHLSRRNLEHLLAADGSLPVGNLLQKMSTSAVLNKTIYADRSQIVDSIMDYSSTKKGPSDLINHICRTLAGIATWADDNEALWKQLLDKATLRLSTPAATGSMRHSRSTARRPAVKRTQAKKFVVEEDSGSDDEQQIDLDDDDEETAESSESSSEEEEKLDDSEVTAAAEAAVREGFVAENPHCDASVDMSGFTAVLGEFSLHDDDLFESFARSLGDGEQNDDYLLQNANLEQPATQFDQPTVEKNEQQPGLEPSTTVDRTASSAFGPSSPRPPPPMQSHRSQEPAKESVVAPLSTANSVDRQQAADAAQIATLRSENESLRSEIDALQRKFDGTLENERQVRRLEDQRHEGDLLRQKQEMQARWTSKQEIIMAKAKEVVAKMRSEIKNAQEKQSEQAKRDSAVIAKLRAKLALHAQESQIVKATCLKRYNH